MLKLTAQTLAPHEQVFAITEGFWDSRALAVATEFGIAELLAEALPALLRPAISRRVTPD
jgi:hypothetical protein